MPNKDRELLFQINDTIKKLSQAPLTTFTAQTGEVSPKDKYNTTVAPRPLPPSR